IYFACDLSPNSLKLAKRGFELSNLDGEFTNADAEHLPYASNSFDLVYSHGVLHHTPSLEVALTEVYRVLKPGGKAIIMLYAKESLTYLGIQIYGRLRLLYLKYKLGQSDFNILLGLPTNNKKLTLDTIISNSTDGVGNPLANIYSKTELIEVFHEFSKVEFEKHYLPSAKLSTLRNIIPRRLKYWLGRKIGGFWYIKVLK
ncbi:hypothetical protein LCGC14_3090150, partial [marine sediment metagenome]